MMDQAQMRHDEQAEIRLRILVKLYDAWPDGVPIQPREVLRPGARFTGAGDVAKAIERLRCHMIEGDEIVIAGPQPAEIAGADDRRFKLIDETRDQLAGPSSIVGKTWIEAARVIVGKAAPTESEADAVWHAIKDAT